MDKCIFCMIANGEIPTNKAYEDDKVIAFYDLEPQAPVHVLIVPKKHYESILAVPAEESCVVGHMFQVASKLANELGATVIAEGGIWEPWQLKKALDSGAHAAVVGTAITRPHEITKRFVNAITE